MSKEKEVVMNGAGIAEIRFLSDSAEEFFRNQTFRGIWYGILSFLELMLIVFVITRNINVFNQKPTKKSFLVALGVFLMLFFSSDHPTYLI